MGQLYDIRELNDEVEDIVNPMRTGSLFRRVQQRNANQRYFNDLLKQRDQETLAGLSMAGYRPNTPAYSANGADRSFMFPADSKPDFQSYDKPPFDDGGPSQTQEQFLNGLIAGANAKIMGADAAQEMDGYVPNSARDAGYTPVGPAVDMEQAQAGDVAADPNAAPAEGGEAQVDADGSPAAGNNEMYRAIKSELMALDDGMSLTGAERMVQAFDKIFAKYENADAQIAKMFLAQQNNRRETDYKPFLGR